MNDNNATEEREEQLDPIRHPGNFSLVYESKDGKLCLFEDAEGHLTVVRAEKLA